MPYVSENVKNHIPLIQTMVAHLSAFSDDEIEGALNYTFTELLASLKRGEDKSWRYKYLNRAVGVLECCKLELYRRAAAPYEDKCIEKNGDVNLYKGVM